MPTNGATSLYSKIISTPLKITWHDIFNAPKKHHDQSDVDYAMIAGTTLDTVKTEIGMLQKWQQPWLYRRILLAGLILSVLIFGGVATLVYAWGQCAIPALSLLLIMIPPCIVPICLMIFFWEMNAPRDISLMQLLGYFFIGGILSLTITMLLHLFVPGDAPMAPFTEEPAKLLATLILLKQLHKKNGKIYGFSGLALGAAVGAGFAAFESAQYAYGCLPSVNVDMGSYVAAMPVLFVNEETILPVLDNILMRNVFAICGHVLYCAPYACVAALNMNKTANILRAFCSVPFWAVFAVSFACHGLWNMFGSISAAIVFTLAMWSTTLYGIRKSFAQLADQVNLASNHSSVTTHLMIQGIRGIHAGVAFALTKSEILIGSDATCQLNYPVSLTDISGIHSKLLIQNGNMYLADLGSRSGTYLNGAKLKPMTGYLLQRGDRFSIGTSGQDFQII